MVAALPSDIDALSLTPLFPFLALPRRLTRNLRQAGNDKGQVT
jgi:hypothetical protein